ncbi:uncharacterized protein LOC117784915 [Drosophila innubila]|uniref:uncharacterized protein LOC117784915 n=1 Tax=Drosophila innubila TaxID=198719 RepID=UPI00148DE4CD|nr:uncharacterized protein LOC117784915 [Drosophila innubila]
MRCILLSTFLILAMLSVCINAGRVIINGVCTNCNRPNLDRTTTHVPTTRHSYGGRSYGRQTTARPRQTYRQPARDDDWSMEGWNLYQTADGRQQISGGQGYRW